MNLHTRTTILCLPILAISASACSQGGSQTFSHDGLTRRYRLHVPEELPSQAPLVLVMHGYGGSSSSMESGYGWPELAEQEQFAVCFPDGTRDQWNNRFWNVGYEFHTDSGVDDTGFLVALTEYLQVEHDLDANRTFATGLSNGGDMSYQLACQASETFAAIGPVVGTMMETLHVGCNPTKPCPVIAFNGTADDITRFDGDMSNSDGWGAYESVPNVIALWVNINDVDKVETKTLPDEDPDDGSVVEFERYSSDAHAREVHFYRVVDGGHDWPGAYGNMDVDATREIWSFFESIGVSEFDKADLDENGQVDGGDLAVLLGLWARPGRADLNGDGMTDGADLSALLGAWTG